MTGSGIPNHGRDKIMGNCIIEQWKGKIKWMN